MTSGSTPAIHVVSDDVAVGEIVRDIATLVVQAGGWIHPHLGVVEHEGHLTLATLGGDDDEDGEPFIALPEGVLIPSGALEWDDAAPDLSLAAEAGHLTALQQDLLHLHIALWNATGKREMFRAVHPKATVLGDDPLRDAIRKLRPTFTPADTGAAVVQTRTFSWRSLADGARTSVVMPILELADHHPLGSPYRVRGGTLGADIRHTGDSPVIHVRYQPRKDALDIACLYGFVTDATTFAVSAETTVDLEGFGTLQVGRTADRSEPPVWTGTAQGLTVSYLPLDLGTGLFRALFRPVFDHLVARRVPRPTARALAAFACASVLDTNRRIVAEIHERARSSAHPGTAILMGAAEHQWSILERMDDSGVQDGDGVARRPRR